MNNYFEVNFTARIGNTIRTARTARGDTVAVFTLTPPDELNGKEKIGCLVRNTRAELLERFTSRGDLITVKGHITSADILLDSGERIKENNIVEITDISSCTSYSAEESA